MVQHAGAFAWDHDVTASPRPTGKRDRIVAGLKDRYEFTTPGGAFYLFPKAPLGTGTEFVSDAIRNNLLIIPGGVFSRRDTHSVSATRPTTTLDRGIEILNRLAKR